MARPASQATAGYFPTPEHLIPAIGSLLTIERDRYDRPLLFDPCAGTGSALLGLAAAVLDLDPADASRYCQAIELEATRAEVLKRRLPHGAAHHGDAFAFGISAAPGVSVLFLNPPYDTDPEHRRLEQRFLGTRLAVLNSQPGATVNDQAPMPAWGWGVVKGPYAP